jgi:hypothetical protein
VIQDNIVLLQQTAYTDRWDRSDSHSIVDDVYKFKGYQ